MTHFANQNENLSQHNRIWLVRDLVEPIINGYTRLYKSPRDNGHRLEYRGVNLTDEQVSQISKITQPYQCRIRLRSTKKYDQIIMVRIYETPQGQQDEIN